MDAIEQKFMDAIEQKLLSLLTTIKNALPEQKWSEIFDLIDKHGEYGIAIESICSLIKSLNIRIDKVTGESIIDLLTAMHFSADEVEYYRGLVNKNLHAAPQHPFFSRR